MFTMMPTVLFLSGLVIIGNSERLAGEMATGHTSVVPKSTFFGVKSVGKSLWDISPQLMKAVRKPKHR